jgi:drug/metabolite transporter (DMT)-like permease
MKNEETKSNAAMMMTTTRIMMEGGSTSGRSRFVKDRSNNNDDHDNDQEERLVAASSTAAAQGTNGRWVPLLVMAFLVCAPLCPCDGFSLEAAGRGGAFRRQRPAQLNKTPLFLSPSSSSSSASRRNHQAKKMNHNNTFRQFYKVAEDDTAVVTSSAGFSAASTTPRPSSPPQAAILYDDFPTSDGTGQWKRLREEQQDLDVEEETDASTTSQRLEASTSTTTSVVVSARNGAMQPPKPPPSDKEEEERLVADAAIAKTKNMARWLLIVSAALYGTNFAVVKSLVDVLPPEIFGTMRFGLAALATLPWLVLPSDSKKMDDGKPKSFWQSDEWGSTLAGLEVGVWTSVGYLAQAEGLGTTLASTSAFVCSLAVVVVPVLDFLLSGGQKRGRRDQWFGMVLALIGVALLEFGSGDSFSGFSTGDLESFIQPFAFGIGFIRMEAAMRKFPTEAKRTTAGQLLAVFFATAAYLALQHPNPGWDMAAILQQTLHDPVIWAGLFWTGIVTTALTVYMETVALQTLTATETTVIFSTEPLWGALTAALLLGESFGPKAIAGGGLVIGACLVSSLGLDGLKAFLPSFGQQQQKKNSSSLPPASDDDIRHS